MKDRGPSYLARPTLRYGRQAVGQNSLMIKVYCEAPCSAAQTGRAGGLMSQEPFPHVRPIRRDGKKRSSLGDLRPLKYRLCECLRAGTVVVMRLDDSVSGAITLGLVAEATGETSLSRDMVERLFTRPFFEVVGRLLRAEDQVRNAKRLLDIDGRGRDEDL